MSFSITIAWYRSSFGKNVTVGSAPSESPWNISRYILATLSGVPARLGSDTSRPSTSMMRRTCRAISPIFRSSSIEGTRISVSLISFASRLPPSAFRLPASGRARLFQEFLDVAPHGNVARDHVFDLPVFADDERGAGGDALVLQVDSILLRDFSLGMEVGQ